MEKNRGDSGARFQPKSEKREADVICFPVVVIGAGASGLAAAIFASVSSDVLIVEGNDKIGKKLLATGNGRCNFTNAGCSARDYNKAGDGFVDTVFDIFSPADTLNFFQEWGMMARLEEGGRYYPYSGQAVSLVDVLKRTAERSGCRFFLSDKAVRAEFSDIKYEETQENGKQLSAKKNTLLRFSLELESGRKVLCSRLIIACGGRAGLKTGSTGDGYGFAKAFGHTLAAPRPALTAVESKDVFLSDLKGVRMKGVVSLYKDGVMIAKDDGEIQFTGSGVSGICVFNLTRFMEAARPSGKKKSSKNGQNSEMNRRKNSLLERNADPARRKTDGLQARDSGSQTPAYEIHCDFVPELSQPELVELLCEQIEGKGLTLQETLSGIVNEKLAKVIDTLAKTAAVRTVAESEPAAAGSAAAWLIAESEPAAAGSAAAWLIAESEPTAARTAAEAEGQACEYSRQNAENAAHLLKNLKISVSHTRGWDEAQVTCGGIRREEIDPRTMESKLAEGLYFCGEVVDVDGKCGGYNLQWAWSSGAVAGKAAGTAKAAEARALR